MCFSLGKGIFCKGENEKRKNEGGGGIFTREMIFEGKLVNEMTNYLLSILVKTAFSYPSVTLTFLFHFHG